MVKGTCGCKVKNNLQKESVKKFHLLGNNADFHQELPPSRSGKPKYYGLAISVTLVPPIRNQDTDNNQSF